QAQRANLLDGLEVVRRYRRHAGLYAIDTHGAHHLGHGDLVFRAEYHSRRLFAVAQRGIVDFDFFREIEFAAYLILDVEGTDRPLSFLVILHRHAVYLWGSSRRSARIRAPPGRVNASPGPRGTM